jgi:ABC-type Fe3+ transport system permease subunit
MAILVWFTIGVALWHFTVFFPDRFWGGIVGALLGAVAGAMITGAIAQIIIGESVGETDFATVLYAVPGVLLGVGFVYLIGTRHEPDVDPYEAPTGRRA